MNQCDRVLCFTREKAVHMSVLHFLLFIFTIDLIQADDSHYQYIKVRKREKSTLEVDGYNRL